MNSFYDGVAPLYVAIDKGRTNAAEILLDYGADPNLRSDGGLTALSLTIRLAGWQEDKSYSRLVKKSLESGLTLRDANQEINITMTALQEAVDGGNKEVLQLLMEFTHLQENKLPRSSLANAAHKLTLPVEDLESLPDDWWLVIRNGIFRLFWRIVRRA